MEARRWSYCGTILGTRILQLQKYDLANFGCLSQSLHISCELGCSTFVRSCQSRIFSMFDARVGKIKRMFGPFPDTSPGLQAD